MSKKFKNKDRLGERMKRYESAAKHKLTRRTPVVIRLDGNAFHTFTKDFVKPFDSVFTSTMEVTMQYLCANIPNCVFGYHQSDEITLVLVDYQKLDTDAWVDYRLEKLCSLSASMASMIFNRKFLEHANIWKSTTLTTPTHVGGTSLADAKCLYTSPDSYVLTEDEIEIRFNTYLRASEIGAVFDARAFNIPKEEVMNCIIWRQADCIRNSILGLGQKYFSSEKLHKKPNGLVITMLDASGHHWDLLKDEYKYGSCCAKKKMMSTGDPNNPLSKSAERNIWCVDPAPHFALEAMDYIDDLVFVGQK